MLKLILIIIAVVIIGIGAFWTFQSPSIPEGSLPSGQETVSSDSVQTPTQTSPKNEKGLCEKQGGKWGIFSHDVQQYQCNLPTEDAGEVCNDSNECQGDCFAELTEQQEKSLSEGSVLVISGKCSVNTLDYYGCYPHVENGKVYGILCSD